MQITPTTDLPQSILSQFFQLTCPMSAKISKNACKAIQQKQQKIYELERVYGTCHFCGNKTL